MPQCDEIAPVDRRRFVARGLALAGAAGLAVAGLGASGMDVLAGSDDAAMLQTAAAIELALAALYSRVSGLSPAVSGTSNPVMATVFDNSKRQHLATVDSINGALAGMGAKSQKASDAAFVSDAVTPHEASLQSPLDVVTLLGNVEDVAAQTYVSYGGAVDPAGKAFTLFAGLAPVAAQRVAVLKAFGGLLLLGAPQLIQIPAPIAQLPAAAGDAAFPLSFYPTKAARPATEGAVQ